MPRRNPEKRAACQRVHARRHYERNTVTIKARARIWNVVNRKAVQAALGLYLQEHPCVVCGESDPVVLEFDHRDPALKEFSVKSNRAFGMALRNVLAEVAKCDVRCANCHRRRHHAEKVF